LVHARVTVPFRNGTNKVLVPPILFETLLDFCVGCASTLKIAFVHHHDLGQIKHHDFL
jgi:hypothetical protein